MTASEKRNEKREMHKLRFNPLSCSLISGGQQETLQIINYHYRGACFKIDKEKANLVTETSKLSFKIGEREIKNKFNFELAWDTIEQNGLFGVKFSTKSSFILKRAERFESNKINSPTVHSIDPLDPNRSMFFKVENISKEGLLLNTSMSNKHLLPGMVIRNATLQAASLGQCKISFYVENSRPSEDKTSIYFGATVIQGQQNKPYQNFISTYISNLSRIEGKDDDNSFDRISVIQQEDFITKDIKRNLTIKEISSEEGYEANLKLRFMCYKNADKINSDLTWKDMGPGLTNEGAIIGAYLGGQLVASCEFRLRSQLKLNIENKLNLENLPFYREKAYAEINKLSVHPSIQKTDTVLGIFQKVHALATLNDNPDGIILAENKLKPLYEKLGFKDTGVVIPHEYLENVNLNLMIIHSETYEISAGMNPYAWSVAFEESQKYFHQIGVTTHKKLGLIKKIVKQISHIVYFFRKKKKKKRQSDQIVTTISRSFAAAKYTKQHLNATILLSYLLEMRDLAGDKWINDLLEKYKFSWDYFQSTSNWVSVLFFDELIEHFSEIGDPYLLNKNAAYRSTKKEILGANYYIIKHFLNPSLAFKALEIHLPKFNKTRTYKLLESSWSSARVRILNNSKELIPKCPSTKTHWTALIDAYVRLATGKPAKIETISSTFDGDEFCEYVVNWENSFLKSRHFLINIPIFLSCVAVAFGVKTTFAIDSYFALWLGPLLFLPIFLYFEIKKYKKMHREILSSYNTFEKEVDKKYQELHTAKSVIEIDYQTSKILDKINFKIQNSISINEILNSSLVLTCEKLDFSRAFIMLIDSDQKFLRTSSIYSKDDDSKALWEYKVDVTKERDKNIFLSSVFNTGQSIIIKNVEEHLPNLNDQSRFLISSLGTNGFSMVPIPGEKSNWGVLIADKKDKENLLSRRDLISLQRVAQSIGLSLDKNKTLEEEKLIRSSFQKYVPSSVVDRILGQQGVITDSINKEVICLFMDIRGFTRISTMIPPKLLIEALNDIYQLLEDEISTSGGVIDKYLGDGALVTWGSIPGSELSCQKALESVFNFLKKVEQYSQKMEEKGLPAIKVGVGVHKGSALVGNIGSNQKKEFTVIGSSVNLASRLEKLNKVYKSHIVISEEIYKNLDDTKLWEKYNAVDIRGYNTSLNIAVFRTN